MQDYKCRVRNKNKEFWNRGQVVQNHMPLCKLVAVSSCLRMNRESK